MTHHDYADHAAELARRWEITMVTDTSLAPHQAMADVDARRIVHPPIRDDVSYVVSMHEMGHIVHANGNVRNEIAAPSEVERARLHLVEEEAAWEWAEANVLGGEWTAGMEQTRKYALGTYLQSLEDAKSGKVRPMDLGRMLDEMMQSMGMGLAPAPSAPPTAVRRRAPVYQQAASSIVTSILAVADVEKRQR